jgi:hypothetical protein
MFCCTYGVHYGDAFEYLSDVLYHLWLPMITLIIISVPGYVVLMRNSVVSILGEDFIISGVFAYPLNENFLGKIIDADIVKNLLDAHEKYGINIAGEGGEIETTVLDAPMFKKR